VVALGEGHQGINVGRLEGGDVGADIELLDHQIPARLPGVWKSMWMRRNILVDPGDVFGHQFFPFQVRP